MPYIGYVHDTLDIITTVSEQFFKYILHKVAAQVPYMGKVINCRSACVHIDLAGNIRHKLLNLFCK